MDTSGNNAEKPKRKFRPRQITYPNKLLRALEEIYTDPDATRQEKMQAVELSIQVLPMRPPVKRKSDKDKALEKLLNSGIKKKGETEVPPKQTY